MKNRIAWLLIPAVVTALAGPVAAAPVTPDLALPKPYVLAAQQETPLAQGLTLTAFERLYPTGWAKGWLLRVDLSHPTLSTDVITAPGVTQGEPLSEMAAKAGAIAAINGDFFDIGQTGIALGATVKSGEYLKSPIPDWPHAAAVGKDQIGRLMSIALEGSVTLPWGTYPLGAINLPTVPSGTIGLFTPQWTIPRTAAMVGAAEAREVVVRQGKVVSVSPVVTDQPVPEDGFVLVGREQFAAPLAQLRVGDAVALSYRADPVVQWAVGGQSYLVGQGHVVAGLNDVQRRPRSALGFSADGRTLFLVTVEGGSAESAGLTLLEMAELMRGFGATEVMELDGGGSSTMVARLPGTQGLSLLNRPSDGKERKIPNGVGVFAQAGTGVARHLEVRGEQRVFPGLTRTLAVAALDEQYGPAQISPPDWRLSGPGEITAEGVYRAPAAGGSETIVTAEAQGLTAALPLRVLGPLERIDAAVGDGLRLMPETGATFTVVGYDRDGYAATIDPADLELTFDPGLVRMEREGDAVRVVPLQEGTGLITVAVQGHEMVIPFAAAFATTVLDAFDHPEGWLFERYPAAVTGAVSPAEGLSGTGMALTYAFGDVPGNRAAYLQAASPLELPGQPQRFGLWVKGDGNGAWLRAVLQDAAGVSRTVDLAPRVDWTDWRYVEAAIPEGVTYPVRLHRVYPVETDTTRRYSGTLLFEDLTVRTAVAMPPAPPAPAPEPDAILRPSAPAGVGSWSFALLGRLPEVDLLPIIGQALEARPTFFLVNAGLAAPVREALAQSGASQVPVYELAPPALYFDVNGVRFILLGTGQGGLRATQFDQLLELKPLLSVAASDPSVRQLVVVGGSTPLAFADPREGSLVQRWLTEFEEQSGKPAAYVGASGVVPAVTRVEGIPFIEAGSPMVPRLFTMDPMPGNLWIRMEP